MNIQSPKRIIVEDFSKDDREVAEKIASSVNIFMDEVFTALSKGISIGDNLNQIVKTIAVTVDASGNPTSTVRFQNSLKVRLSGILVLRSIGVLVTTTPFIDFTESSGLIQINNITGLSANTEYQLVILMIGN